MGPSGFREADSLVNTVLPYEEYRQNGECAKKAAQLWVLDELLDMRRACGIQEEISFIRSFAALMNVFNGLRFEAIGFSLALFCTVESLRSTVFIHAVPVQYENKISRLHLCIHISKSGGSRARETVSVALELQLKGDWNCKCLNPFARKLPQCLEHLS